MRKIWIAVLMLIFLVPVVTIAAVNASHDNDNDHAKPANEKGTLAFSQGTTISGPTKGDEGENTITVVHETLTFTGNFTGSANTIQRNVKHNDTDDGKTFIFTTFHGQGNYTGTLNGVTVTLHIRYEGVMNSTFVRGNFVVHGDTSANNGVNGEGHFRGSPSGGEPAGINYTAHSHVSSHAEHPETDDEKEDE